MEITVEVGENLKNLIGLGITLGFLAVVLTLLAKAVFGWGRK